MGKEMQAIVAREHRVSNQVVSILCCAVKRQPKILDELISKREEAENRREMIANIVQEKNDGMLIIDSSA